jgi:FlaG/FlaF family flagellin (archaellin)
MFFINKKLFNKISNNKFSRSLKKRGVSPVIAVMLMIGLTVLSGVVLISVSNSILSQETQVNLNIDNQSAVYKTTETDYRFVDELIDELQIQIENPLEEPILVDLTQTYLYNATDDTILSNWGVVSDVGQIVLNGKESTTITFATDSTSYTSELKENDQVYVVFQSKLFGSKNQLTSLKSSTFTVELSGASPLFQALPVISASQTEDTLYFSGDDQTEVTKNLTIAIFNFGNADESYEKTVTITLENNTLFSIADGLETQFVTIPSASQGGDFGAEGFCETGEACVNVSFPIIKHNITEVGLTNVESNTYGAIISVSGLDFISYKLVLVEPEFKIALENKKKGGVSFNTIIFDGKINKEKDVFFKVNVWNLMDYANNGTFELYDYNTTVFEFKTKKGKTDPNPVSLDFVAGPPKNFAKCISNDACEKIDWGLTRKKLVDNDGNLLGIEAGTYTAKIRELRTGQTIVIYLIIPEYVQPIHVDAMDAKALGKNKIDLVVTIRDSDGNAVKNAKVYITWTRPDGTTDTDVIKTNKKGEAKFLIDAKIKGVYEFTVTSVEKKTQKNIVYPYDASANVVTTITLKV